MSIHNHYFVPFICRPALAGAGFPRAPARIASRPPGLGRLLGYLLLALAALWAMPSNAQSALDGFNPNASDHVRSLIVQPDGKVLVGGEFTAIAGQPRGRIARLHADGSLDTSFINPSASSTVHSMALQPDGKVLVAGEFTSIAGQTRSRIARLNANGSLDTSFNPGADGVVFSLALQPDGKVLMGGRFTQIAGQPRSRIARLNADGSLDASFNPGADNSVQSLVVQPDGKVLAAGYFLEMGGQLRNRIARLNADGSLDAGFTPNINAPAQTLALQPDGKVLVGGFFTGIDGQTRTRIARLNVDGSLEADFHPDFNNAVYTVAVQPDGKLLVGGLFDTLGGQTRKGIARLNTDGSLDARFHLDTSGGSYSMVVQPDGQVLVGGFFSHISGQPRNNIARVNADGSLETDFIGPKADETLFIFGLAVQPDGKILALLGGELVRGQGRRYMVRLQADGSLDTSFIDPGASDWIYSLAVQPDSRILVGGFFKQLGGQPRKHIARLNIDGSLDADFDPGVGASGWVTSLALQPNGQVVLGGDFTRMGGQTRNRVARLNADGSLDTSFIDPGANDGVAKLTLQPDGKVLVAGAFTEMGGQPRNYIARLNADGSLDASFDPGAGDSVYSLVVQPDGKVLVAGAFTKMGGQSRSFIARLNADGSLDTSFNPGADWIVFSLALQPDGKVLMGGWFMQVSGKPRNRIARLNADGSLDTSFKPDVNGGVTSLFLQPDGKVLMGGDFTKVGGQARNRIARLSSVDAALQSLQLNASHDTLEWQRSGAGPEVTKVRFALALTENASESEWQDLGPASRTAGGWQRKDLALPKGRYFWVRAQGVATGGLYNNSSSLVQSTAMFFKAAAEPDAPTAVAAALTGNTARVSWSAPANDGGSPITHYRVTSVEDASLSCSPNPATATTCDIADLNYGSSYTFTVVATNAVGDSLPSAPSNAVVPITTAAAPTITGVEPGDAQVIVRWTAPSDTGGTMITGYTATATTTGAPPQVAGSCSTSATPPAAPDTFCTIGGLDNGTPYSITVYATTSAGSGGRATPAPATPVASVTLPAAALPTGTVGQRYSASIVPAGGTPPYRVSTTAGSLPQGLAAAMSPDGRSITITGTPTQAQTASFTLTVSDSTVATRALATRAGPTVPTAVQTYSIAVQAAAQVAAPAPVPTLLHGALALLSVLAGALGMRALRSRQ